MSKSIITTTSAAFLLMSSVAFAGSNLDEGSIQVLGNAGSAANIALSSRSGSASLVAAKAGSSANIKAKAMARDYGNDQAMMVLDAYIDTPRGDLDDSR